MNESRLESGTPALLARLLVFFRPHRRAVALAVGSFLALLAIEVALPGILGRAIDSLHDGARGDDEAWDAALALGLLFAGLGAARGLMQLGTRLPSLEWHHRHGSAPNRPVEAVLASRCSAR